MKRYGLVPTLATRRVCWLGDDLEVRCQDVLTSALTLEVTEDETDLEMVSAAVQAAAMADAWDTAATLVAQYRLKKFCCRCGQFFRGRGVSLQQLELGSGSTAVVCSDCAKILRMTMEVL